MKKTSEIKDDRLTKGTNFATWKINRSEWLFEVYSPELYDRMHKWSFCKPGPARGVNHFRRQFVIPAKKSKWVFKVLGIVRDKNPNRVRVGKQDAIRHPVQRG